MLRFHVTHVSGNDLYGHNIKHCDPSGCAGIERYLGQVKEGDDEIREGDIIEKLPSMGGRWIREIQ